MTSSTTGSSKSLTPTELVETRKAALGLRLSVYATMLGIFAFLVILATIVFGSFPIVGASGQAAIRWSMLTFIWVYSATAVINVLASVLMIGAPPQMKVIVIGLIYAVFTFLACVHSWLSLLGLPFASGFLGNAILLIQYPAWLMYIARSADFADNPQAKDLLKSAIGLACIGLTFWIGIIIQGAVMVHLSTWAASMGRLIEGSTLAHLLLIQGLEYQTLLWAIPIAATVLACLLLMWAARFTQGVLRHILKSVVKGIVLASLTVLVGVLSAQIPYSSPSYLYVPLALPVFMLAAIIPLVLALLRGFRASLMTLRALDGVVRDAATGPDSSALEQPVALYKRRPLLLGWGMMVGVAGVVLLVYGLGRASGSRPRQYPSTIAALRDAARSSNSRTPRRPVQRLTVGMPAPELNLARIAYGQPVEAFLQGQVYVVEFWGTWCAPCLDGIPRLSLLATTYAKEVVFLSITNEPDDVVDDFLATQRPEENKTWADSITYTIGLDNANAMHDSLFRAAGQSGIPCVFVIGRDGIVEWIGHPNKLGSILEEVVAGTFERSKPSTLDEIR